jgi:hypothetical protein
MRKRKRPSRGATWPSFRSLSLPSPVRERVLLVVLLLTYILLLFSDAILRIIGRQGAAILVRVMGIIETHSLPTLTRSYLVALPSMSLHPSAPFLPHSLWKSC